MKKICLRLFNKKTPLYAGLGSKQKAFRNCQATYQKELCLLFEIRQFFSQSECTDRLEYDPSGKSNSLFQVEAETLNLLLFYADLMFFLCAINT